MKAEKDEKEAHLALSKSIVAFFDLVTKQSKSSLSYLNEDEIFDISSLLMAMQMENSYFFKDPCNDNDLINKENPLCLSGSPWVTKFAQTIMAGDIPNTKINVSNLDTFHPSP